METFRKTNHFLLRQWERGIDDIDFRKILRYLPDKITQKTYVFVSQHLLKKLRLKILPTTTLVIVIEKQNILITLFLVDDFWAYIRTSSVPYSIII